jgi:hypothetical protein
MYEFFISFSLIGSDSLGLFIRFTERGKIFAKQEIRAIQIGPGGIFFTGDGTGQVKVWKWCTEPTAALP